MEIQRVIRIGRGAHNDIVLANPKASKEHLELVRTEAGEYYLKDLDSTNGSYKNEVLLPPDEWQMIHSHDVIKVGGEELAWLQYFDLEEKPPSLEKSSVAEEKPSFSDEKPPASFKVEKVLDRFILLGLSLLTVAVLFWYFTQVKIP